MSESKTEMHRFTCRLDFEPAGLERLFQVVRRRGFVIERVNAAHEADQLHVDLTVSGVRSAETLRAQLEKLHVVHSVQRPLDQCFVADTRSARPRRAVDSARHGDAPPAAAPGAPDAVVR